MWNLLESTSYPLFYLIALPILVRNLGDAGFGIFVLVNTIITVAGFVHTGLGNTLIIVLSNERIKGEVDWDKVSGILVWVLACALLAPLAFYGLAKADAALHIFNYESAFAPMFQRALFFGALLFCLKLVEEFFLNIMRGHERYDWASRSMILAKNLLLSIFLVGSFYTADLATLFALAAICYALVPLLQYGFLKRHLRMHLRIAQFQHAKALLIRSKWFLFQSFFTISAGQIDKILVGSLLSVEQLGFYSIGLFLVTQFHTVLTSISSWIFPKVASHFMAGRPLLKHYYQLQSIVLVLGFLGLTVLLLGHDWLITIWMKENHEAIVPIVLYFLLYEAFAMAGIIPFFYFNATRKERASTIFILINFSISVLAMFQLYEPLGVFGLILGKGLGNVVTSLLSRQFLHYRVLGERYWSVGLQLLLPSFLFVASFAPIWEWWLRLPAALVGLYAFWAVYLRKAELKELLRRFQDAD